VEGLLLVTRKGLELQPVVGPAASPPEVSTAGRRERRSLLASPHTAPMVDGLRPVGPVAGAIRAAVLGCQSRRAALLASEVEAALLAADAAASLKAKSGSPPVGPFSKPRPREGPRPRAVTSAASLPAPVEA